MKRYQLPPNARLCVTCGRARMPDHYAPGDTTCRDCRINHAARVAKHTLAQARRAELATRPYQVKCNHCGKLRAGTYFPYVVGTAERAMICNACIRGPSSGGIRRPGARGDMTHRRVCSQCGIARSIMLFRWIEPAHVMDDICNTCRKALCAQPRGWMPHDLRPFGPTARARAAARRALRTTNRGT